MNSGDHRSFRKIKMKYFTPPSTFEALWLEFHQSANHMKMLILDFFMALSKLFRTISHVLAALWEALEVVVYFLLTILNVIWLFLKIILVLGEQIKALGPNQLTQQHTPKNNYCKEDSAKFDSINKSLTDSQTFKKQHIEYNDITKEAIHHNHTGKMPVYSTYTERKTISSNCISKETQDFDFNKGEQTNSYGKDVSQPDSTKEKPFHHSITKNVVHLKYTSKDNEFAAFNKNKVSQSNTYRKEFTQLESTKEKPFQYSVTKGFVHSKYISGAIDRASNRHEHSQSNSYRQEFAHSDTSNDKPVYYSTPKTFVHSKYIAKEGDHSDTGKNLIA
ncbi:uncharacterized protein LOC120930882 [Rana temporaria]|uniref:uncharacterized protein LOC120930882 n=1 Tax=Rana temporaria TaxID=8407 RepID=UPI001AADC0E9|nr:uncharacterized protein LOC120930882 [Rana temporaria]